MNTYTFYCREVGAIGVAWRRIEVEAASGGEASAAFWKRHGDKWESLRGPSLVRVGWRDKQSPVSE